MNIITKTERTVQRFSDANISWSAIKNSIREENYQNSTIRGLAYFFRDLIFFAACFTGLVLLDAWYYIVPLWLLSGLVISGLFVIGHDAAHGSLFENKRLAHWITQICFLPAMHPFSQWTYGHNRVHHGKTVEVGSDPVWHPTSPDEYRAMSWYGRLCHRFYWSALGAGPYYMIEIWLKKLLLDAEHQKVQGALRDKCIVIGFGAVVSAALLYFGGTSGELSPATFDWQAGAWMWLKVFAIPFLNWTYLSGTVVYLQHINEAIPWKKPEDWSPSYGQLFATVNFHIPSFINFFIHNIFVHVPHHVQVRIPFYHLKPALEDIKAQYGEFVLESRTPVRDYFRTISKCKLFDPQSGRWLRYADIK